jgi:ribosome-binding protein aMBF1 (putative translation factor)
MSENDEEGWTVVSYKKKPKVKNYNNDYRYSDNIPQQTYKPKLSRQIVAKNTTPNQQLRKIDNETDNFTVKKFGPIGKEIASARLALNLTQKELAVKLNLPANLIQNIENGTAVYDGNIYSKIKNVLKPN